MLEIWAIWALTKKIGSMLEEKGRKSGWYKVLTVILWFGGEIVGAIIGAVITGGDEDAACLLYAFALGGAAAGAGIAYAIASSVPAVYRPPSQDTVSATAMPIPEVFTPAEAAQYLHMPESQVLQLIEKGHIQAKKVGETYRITHEALDTYRASWS